MMNENSPLFDLEPLFKSKNDKKDLNNCEKVHEYKMKTTGEKITKETLFYVTYLCKKNETKEKEITN